MVEIKCPTLWVGMMMIALVDCDRQTVGDYPIQPIPFMQVSVEDAFWTPRMETNRSVTIPYAFQQCEETHRIDNFAVAGGLKQGAQQGYRFNDSDVFKIIEGAAYTLHLFPDPELEEYVDGVIDIIAAAQEEDGYLFTAKTAFNDMRPAVRTRDRWDNIRDDHELYNVGHMYEAAVAYFQATGKRKLLDVSIKNADLIDRVFGPEGMRYPPGHEEIEIGLAKLYRQTGDIRYLNLAKFFLDERGDSTGHELYGEYAQDHMPVVEQAKAVGHAVRAAYLYTGMADIASMTGNEEYIRAIQRIWEDVLSNKLYITGGIGATGGNEGFDRDYHLPNSSAYCETCASIANAMWNHRLFLMTGDAKYMDIVERVIFNSFLSGISMNGDRFFYPNRLQTFSGMERSPWFACACCPGNIVRFLPSIPGYAYAVRGNDLYVNLFIGGRARIPLRQQSVGVTLESDYPWGGKIRIVMESDEEASFRLHLRIPGWAQNRPVPSDLYRYAFGAEDPVTVTVNGEHQTVKMRNGFAVIDRRWKAGDKVELDLPMPIRRVIAHDGVEADRGRVAVERGPIVFCAEWPDIPGGMVRNIVLPNDAELSTRWRPGLLNSVQVIHGQAFGIRLMEDDISREREAKALSLIPYYAWAHRGKGEMSVWLAREEEAAIPLSGPTIASMSRVSASFGRRPEAVQDQLEPKSSIDHDVPYFHWWPHKGTEEWIRYDFKETATVSSTSVYWFDDTGMGECRLPDSWRVFYLEGNRWQPVKNLDSYGVDKNRFNEVRFEPVHTRALRLTVRSPEGFAGGIHEWKVR